MLKEVDTYLYKLFPHFILFVLILFNTVDMGLLHTENVRPNFLYMGLFALIFLRPELIPQTLIFLYGIFFDVLNGLPIGLSAFLSLTLYFIIESGRRYLSGQSWPVLWCGFILSYGFLLVLEILFFTIFKSVPLDNIQQIGNFLITIITFPLLFIFFLGVDKWLSTKIA